MDKKQKLITILPVQVLTMFTGGMLKQYNYTGAANTVKVVGNAVSMALLLGAIFEKDNPKQLSGGQGVRTWNPARLSQPRIATRMKTLQQWYNTPATMSKLLDFLEKEEGLKRYVYLDSAGYKTIGIGHRIFANETHLLKYTKTNPMPTSEVIELLKYDVLDRALAKGEVFKRITGVVPEGFFMAFVSLCYNTGPRNLYKAGVDLLINAGFNSNKSAIAAKMGSFVNETINNVKVPNVGLILRRMREAAFYAPEHIAQVFTPYKSHIVAHRKDWSLKEFNAYLALSKSVNNPPNIT